MGRQAMKRRMMIIAGLWVGINLISAQELSDAAKVQFFDQKVMSLQILHLHDEDKNLLSALHALQYQFQ